jgi:hypothetical protein
MFDLHVVRCGSKVIHQKYMCLKEIGLCDDNMLTILESMVNMIGGTYMTT